MNGPTQISLLTGASVDSMRAPLTTMPASVSRTTFSTPWADRSLP